MENNPLDLEALKKLCETTKDIVVLRESGDPSVIAEFGEWIEAARTAMPKLIDEVEWLRKIDNGTLSELSAIRGENRSLHELLNSILEFCGPPKMSESVGTMHTRLKQIKAQIDEALEK